MIHKMLLSFLLLGMIVVSPVAMAYDQDNKINQTDTQGKKQGLWIYFGKDRPEEGYPANGKIEEGTYKDDRKEGIWIKYHNDGVTPRLRGDYINNRPQGSYVKYHANGKIKEKGSFEKNQYRDSLIRYNENGKIEYEAKYNGEGKEQGSIKYYYPNGQVEFEYTAQNGNPVGTATRYYENGDVKEAIVYAEDGSVAKSEPKALVNPIVHVKDPGQSTVKPPAIAVPRTNGVTFSPNGYNKVYNNNAEIWLDGVFKNGNLWEGKVYEYDKDGILLKVSVFKNGLYHSDGQL
jgi:antitoxin component YwqK of YwqJK toxin-antitoxin module